MCYSVIIALVYLEMLRATKLKLTMIMIIYSAHTQHSFSRLRTSTKLHLCLVQNQLEDFKSPERRPLFLRYPISRKARQHGCPAEVRPRDLKCHGGRQDEFVAQIMPPLFSATLSLATALRQKCRSSGISPYRMSR